MKIHRSLKLAIAALLFVALPSTGYALLAPEAVLEDTLTEDERDALETLALSDERMRDAILEASLHPRAVERIASIRAGSSEHFRDRLNQVSRSTQKDIWELVRYPELVDALTLGGRPSSRALDDIVAPYPDDVGDIAVRTVNQDFNLLNDIAHIRSDAERETEKLIASLPFSAQANFEALIERPDLMTALADNPAVADHLGSLYRKDPFETRANFDRYHEAASERNEEALAEWRDAIEDDPDAQEELIESAEQFADEEGYDSPREIVRVVERTEVHHYNHPYPYWFGPPHWYASHHWYPHRSHWGFAFDTGGAFFVFGLPSPFYSSWHYREPARRHHYRHLDRHFTRHAKHHRSRRGSSIRDHARSHKRSKRAHDYRTRDGHRSRRDVHVADYRDGSRSRKSFRDNDRRRGVRSHIGSRNSRDDDRDVRPRKRKSKFRDATKRAKRRSKDGRSIRSRTGDRSKDRSDSFARRSRDSRDKKGSRSDNRIRERSPKREKTRTASNKKSIRSKERRGDSNKIAKRSGKSLRSKASKRSAKRSSGSKFRPSKRSKSSKSKSSKSSGSSKKKSGKGKNGGRNFGRR